MESGSSKVELMDFFHKPKNDQKQYRALRLTNEMKVMLVHDERVREDEYCGFWPSCALTIAVGSLSDPSDVPGLAKLVAHILSQCNKDFSKNLDRWSSNIDSEETTIAFSLRIESLDDALAHLVQLLKSSANPKQETIKDYLDLNAWPTNPLYFANDKILSMLGNFGYPSKYVEWQDMTMAIISQRIEEFKNRHYSAHRMSLCLKTSMSLDEMQELIVKHFSALPNNKLPGIDFTSFTHENAFQKKFHENVYFVEAHDDCSQITLNWCVPCETSAAKCKPYGFLKYILETEREENLINCLKMKSCASESYVTLETNAIFSLFSIEIICTARETEALDDVIEALFSYLQQLLRKLKKCESLEQLYRDFDSAENSSQFYEVANLDIVQRLARNLMYQPSEYQPSDGFDAGAIHEAIDALSSPNFNVIVISRDKYVEGIEFELEDESTGMKYTERKRPDKWFSLWNNPTMFAEIGLPTPNPYIAHDFTILYDGSQSVSKYPTKVYESDVSELWYRQDDKFLTPDVDCQFYFQSPLVQSSVKNLTMAMMFAYLVNAREYRRTQHLPRLTYVDAYFDVFDGRLLLNMIGPNEKLHSTVKFVTEELKHFHENVTKAEFGDAMQDSWMKYNRRTAPLSDALANDIRMSIIRVGHASTLDMFRCMKSIEFTEMQDFCRQVFDHMKIYALIQGNITADGAKSIMQTVEFNLGCAKIEEPKTAQPSARILPPGTHNFSIKSPDRSHYQSATIVYYQIGPKSLRNHVLIKLLLEVAASLLRTNIESKKRLTDPWYPWHSFNDCGILGYSIAICSHEDEDRPNDVARFIQEINHKLIPFITDMSAKQFNKIISCMKNKKIDPDHNVANETDRNWTEILNGDYLFDRHFQEMEILSTISQSELLQFYRDHSGPNERKLLVQCIGHGGSTEVEANSTSEDDELSANVIHTGLRAPESGVVTINTEVFKKSLEIYQS